MEALLLWIGRLAGSVGFLVCVAAVLARITGTWKLGGMFAGTLFQAGVAAMILSCLAYCAYLAERKPR